MNEILNASQSKNQSSTEQCISQTKALTLTEVLAWAKGKYGLTDQLYLRPAGKDTYIFYIQTSSENKSRKPAIEQIVRDKKGELYAQRMAEGECAEAIQGCDRYYLFHAYLMDALHCTRAELLNILNSFIESKHFRKCCSIDLNRVNLCFDWTFDPYECEYESEVMKKALQEKIIIVAETKRPNPYLRVYQLKLPNTIKLADWSMEDICQLVEDFSRANEKADKLIEHYSDVYRLDPYICDMVRYTTV
ncbi:MAG: hypothetical protein K2N63_12760 [Lachnospiraceae bacterium]|nr:hypothetical protein [Lachnospiraceae bacterium]